MTQNTPSTQLTKQERAARRHFLQGVVCAALQRRPDALTFYWQPQDLEVRHNTPFGWWSYNMLHNLVTTLDQLGYTLTRGCILIIDSNTIRIHFYDPYRKQTTD